MKLESLMISFLIFTGVILGLAAFYSDMLTTYSPDGNSTSANAFNQFNESFNTINDQLNETADKAVNVATKPAGLIEKTQQSILVFLNLGGVLLTMSSIPITFTSQAIGMLVFIPEWFRFMVMTIITLLFAYKVAAIVFRQSDL